ncbi:MAG: L-lactate MFS transporter [Brevibacterium aurantiacum]|uniref:L-lactate MFS transporter n=1 Tax=Brevibacterium aurantiacum TaxID=273384 RepID=UPI000BB9BB4F|nr:OFA family MFS transporter [Brevibacterium aurantiacum]PCC56229.1 MFS transporter [Brevibacterium aurantiacum]
MASVLTRSAIVAPKNFNRWLIPPAALAIHLCIGQVYAFSVFKIPFMSHFDAGEVSIGWIFSIAILMLGISSAIFGPWVEKNGPRASMVAAGTCWVIGFFVASLGIMTGQLWLVYLGYGVIGGIGLGIGYISPVSTLMKWFPDRPGLATGLAIMGFGGGALIASPMSNQLMSLYGGGPEPENLVAGLTPTFVTLGIVYAVVIAAGAFVIRVPHPEWTPKNFDPAKATTKPMQTTGNVSVRNAIRTPQFWLLWVALFLNVTAGIGILENAAPMIQSYFGITAAAAAGFVGLLSIGNMGGRFIWSTTSDYLGRKNNYMMYLGVGAILYLLVALFGGGSIILFVLATLIIISFYGGGFSTVPAYLKDLFGVYQVGAIHGALLTAWSAAGVAGPLIVNSVVEAGEAAGKEGPELYTPGMFIMVGALVVGFIANVLVRPVSERFFEREDVKAKQAAALEDDN